MSTNSFIYKLSNPQVNIWNLRLKLRLLAGAIEELAQFGPAKQENEQGLDNVGICVSRDAAVPSKTNYPR